MMSQLGSPVKVIRYDFPMDDQSTLYLGDLCAICVNNPPNSSVTFSMMSNQEHIERSFFNFTHMEISAKHFHEQTEIPQLLYCRLGEALSDRKPRNKLNTAQVELLKNTNDDLPTFTERSNFYLQDLHGAILGQSLLIFLQNSNDTHAYVWIVAPIYVDLHSVRTGSDSSITYNDCGIFNITHTCSSDHAYAQHSD